jgi:hypothetical protein
MDDRGRLLFGYLALYLDAKRDPADATSGLTPTRMAALCSELAICSRGRAAAMLSLMRFAGFVRPDTSSSDRRQRRLVSTAKLHALLHDRWQVHFSAMAPLLPDGAALVAALDDPAFVRALVIAMGERFRAGFRFMTDAPELGLFAERSGGLLILASLITAGDPDDSLPPTRPVPISIAGLARRFSVSRPHVLKLITDAAEQGLIERSEAAVRIAPALGDGLMNFFARMYLFFADCAREARQATCSPARA